MYNYISIAFELNFIWPQKTQKAQIFSVKICAFCGNIFHVHAGTMQIKIPQCSRGICVVLRGA